MSPENEPHPQADPEPADSAADQASRPPLFPSAEDHADTAGQDSAGQDSAGQDTAPSTEPAAPRPNRNWEKVRHTRTGRAWTGLIVGAVVLVLLLVFILQNLDSTQVNVLFWEWNLPIGVAVLFAAIVGALLAGLIGGARIAQLRRAAKKKV